MVSFSKQKFQFSQILIRANTLKYALSRKSTFSSNQIATIEGDRLTDLEFEKIIYLLAQRNNLT